MKMISAEAAAGMILKLSSFAIGEMQSLSKLQIWAGVGVCQIKLNIKKAGISAREVILKPQQHRYL